MNIDIQKQQLRGIQLSEISKGVLNNSFFTIIVGPPGQGKTSLIDAMLKNPNFYYQKFDYVIVVGHSQLNSIQLTQQNNMKQLDSKSLLQFCKQINSQQELENFNLLIIMDDCVSEMKTSDKQLKILAMNRRHLIKKGTISFIITTQKFTLIPTFMRSCVTELFLFKLNQYQTASIYGKEHRKQYKHIGTPQFYLHQLLIQQVFQQQILKYI